MKIEFNSESRFLSINVYQFPLGDCGGITDMAKYLFIPCADGPIKFDDIEIEDLIFIEEKRGEEYWALKPNTEHEGMVGPMSGGNLAYSSDSRCKRIYHIHDRFESQKTYDAMSN